MARIRMSGEELVRKLLEDERDFTGIVLEGGFDLSGHPAFSELQEHFDRRKDHYTGDVESYWQSPITFDAAILMGLVAKGLRLPVLRAEGAILDDADFTGADLRGSYLQHARLYDVNFQGANLSTILSNTNHGYRNTDLRFGRFLRTKSRGTKYDGANFQNADMSCSDFRDASFRNADWGYANAQQSDFRGADLFCTAIFNTNLQDVDLRGAKHLESMTKGTSSIPFALFLRTIVNQEGYGIISPLLPGEKFKSGSLYLIVKE